MSNQLDVYKAQKIVSDIGDLVVSLNNSGASGGLEVTRNATKYSSSIAYTTYKNGQKDHEITWTVNASNNANRSTQGWEISQQSTSGGQRQIKQQQSVQSNKGNNYNGNKNSNARSNNRSNANNSTYESESYGGYSNGNCSGYNGSRNNGGNQRSLTYRNGSRGNNWN